MQNDACSPRLATAQLLSTGLAVLAMLVATGNGYGYHRDELYFRVAGERLQWGYPDQPPLTPLLGHLSIALFGDSPRGLRVIAALAVCACVFLSGLIARELGGSRLAQTTAAVAVGVSGILVPGHLLSTAVFDIGFWTTLSWLLVRLLRTGQEALWLPIGLVTGLALLNKHLVLLFWIAFLLGVLLSHRVDVLRSRLALAGALVAAMLWAPNLMWQAQHGWPQLALARKISDEDPLLNRALLLPLQLAIIGPLLAFVWLAGLRLLAREEAMRRYRPFAWAYCLLILLVLLTGGKAYYLAGIYPLLIAAGAVVFERRRLSRRLLVSGAAASLALSALVGLPIIPIDKLHATPIPVMNEDAVETIGWRRLAESVAAVHRHQPDAAVFTANYGEAGAIDRYGAELGLPPAASGHNGYADWSRPPDSTQTAVVVGVRDRAFLRRSFRDCRLRARFDNGVGLENEEQGTPIYLCGLRAQWSAVWPRLRHLDP